MGLKTFSIILIILAGVLMLPVTLYDPMDEETALGRYGHKDGRPATTQEMLDARETWSPPPNQYGWLWKPALLCAALGGVGLFLSRKKS